MPLIHIQTPAEVPDGVLAGLSRLTAEVLGKPEKYVMASASRAELMMEGTAADAAFVEVRSIGGLTREVNAKLSKEICALLGETLGLPAEHIYLNFIDVPAAQWGWNSSLFG